MTVQELRDALRAIPDDALVVLAKDAEGNAFSPLSDTNAGRYRAETTWYGDFCGDDDEYTLPERSSVVAVALWPVN